jgi:Short C-terminal domain/Phospholipase_D-nuclease N-terminal
MPSAGRVLEALHMLAYDYPVLGAFMTFLWFFIWILWLFLLFRVLLDVFRSQDLSGWGKALWIIFMILLPFLGVLVYVIVRGRGMTERDVQRAQASQDAFKAYVQETAASTASPADQIAKLADLKERGAITDDEFQAQKAKILA